MKDEKTQWTVPTKLKIYYSIFNENDNDGWKAGLFIFILPVYKGYNIVNYHVDGSECLGWSLLSIPVLFYWQCSFQSSFHFIFSTSDGSLINHHLQVSFILCQYKLSNRYTIYLSISQQIIQIHIFSLSRTSTVSLSEKNCAALYSDYAGCVFTFSSCDATAAPSWIFIVNSVILNVVFSFV